jgi:hypothetical protein
MKRCLSLTLLLALALALPATASAKTFGAAVGSVFENQTFHIWSSERVMQSLDALHADGGTVARADSNWQGAEPKAPKHGRHTFKWAYDDQIVTEMAQAHLRWEPTLQFAPKWAEAHRPDVVGKGKNRFVVPLPPGNNGVFAYYASAFMKRYGPHGAFWKNRKLPYLPVTTVEVWNEPDNSYNWGPGVNLHNYANMYESVRSAVHHVNRSTKVLTGGLAWTRSSLPRLLKAFRGKPLDAVAVHPYAATPGGTIAAAKFALAEMRAYGRGSTPLLANEFGWTAQQGTWGSTNPKHVKSYVYSALVGLGKLKLSQIIPFQWADSRCGLNDGPFAAAVKKVNHRR